MWRINLLGSPEVWHNDRLTERFVSKKARALFYYLVTEREMKNRNELATFLWDDFNLPTAQNNLRTTLYHLKKEFAECLEIQPRQVRFCLPETANVDIDQMRAIQPGSTTEELQKACAAYRGDFLAGFSLEDAPRFEAWKLKTRVYFQRLAIGHMLQLAGHYDRQNRLEDGLAITGRILELQPLNESALLYRLQFFARLGWSAQAIQEYQDYADTLQKQAQSAPAAALTAVYDSIHDTRPTKARSNLPRRLTSFFGREQELKLLSNRLLDPAHPLVNLWGGGGMGKTRLALEAGEKLKMAIRDGVYYVSLKDTLGEVENIGEEISTAICQAIRAPVKPELDLKDQMIDAIRDLQTLLILDNFRPTPAAEEFLSELLEAVVEVQFLVISRQRLRLPYTTAIYLRGLDYPHLAQAPGSFDPYWLKAFTSIQLFEERAQRVRPEFRLDEGNWREAARICEIFQGMPLALELVAVLMRYLTIQQVLYSVELDPTQIQHLALEEQLSEQLKQILESTYAQTHPRHREIVSACTLFQGGFTLEAFETVTGTSMTMLNSLIDASLVQPIGSGRYTMHPLTQNYLKEKTGAAAYRYRAPYCHYYLEWLIRQDNTLDGELLPVTMIYSEMANIHSAWQNALALGEFELIRRACYPLTAIFRSLGLIEQAHQKLSNTVQFIEALPEKNAAQLAALGAILLELSRVEEMRGNLAEASK